MIHKKRTWANIPFQIAMRNDSFLQYRYTVSSVFRYIVRQLYEDQKTWNFPKILLEIWNTGIETVLTNNEISNSTVTRFHSYHPQRSLRLIPRRVEKMFVGINIFVIVTNWTFFRSHLNFYNYINTHVGKNETFLINLLVLREWNLFPNLFNLKK